MRPLVSSDTYGRPGREAGANVIRRTQSRSLWAAKQGVRGGAEGAGGPRGVRRRRAAHTGSWLVSRRERVSARVRAGEEGSARGRGRQHGAMSDTRPY